MLDDAHSRHAFPHNLGNLAIVEVLDEAQDDHAPVFISKAQDRLAHALPVGLSLQDIRRVAVATAVDQCLRKLRARLARPQVANAQIMGDAHEPGHERGPPHLIAFDRPPRLQERLRREVLRFSRVAYHVVDVPVHSGHMAVVEQAERFAVTLDRARYQRSFLLLLGLSDIKHSYAESDTHSL